MGPGVARGAEDGQSMAGLLRQDLNSQAMRGESRKELGSLRKLAAASPGRRLWVKRVWRVQSCHWRE